MLATPVLAVDRNFVEIMDSVFSRADTLAHPKDLVPHLQSLSVVWSVIFLVAGLVCLINGYKFYKWVTMILAALLGMFAGYAMGKSIHAEYIVAGSLAVLFAVACWPLMKYAVAVMGGLAGAFLGANAWTAIAHIMADPSTRDAAVNNYWVGALCGLLIFGMLSFVLFKFSVVVFTSVSGATLAVLGGMALLLQVPPWQQSISSSITAHALVVPLLVFVPAVIGLIMQQVKPGAGAPPGAAKPTPKPA